MSNIIELNAKTAKAGRVPIKLILHKIHDDPVEFNENGIHWDREYSNSNKDSVSGMPLVCQFADEENSIPFGGHGDMTRDSENNDISFQNSLVVGSFEDSYIGEIEVNDKKISGLIGVGYIYSQRFPCLVKYLEEQYANGNSVLSSVEICGDKAKGNTNIYYDGGWKEKGRIPKEYQYSGQALCIGVEAADNNAVMIELNQHIKDENKQTEGKKKMDEKILELNQKIEDNVKTITELSSVKVELETKNAELSTTVVTANKTVEELNAKIATLETELNTVTSERDSLKSEKTTAENEQKKVEINSYFTTEISKNGFTDEEINSLKHFVDEIDLTGLKQEESELCAKKFKEMISKKTTDVETNSSTVNFIAFHEKTKKVITNDDPKFFEEV